MFSILLLLQLLLLLSACTLYAAGGSVGVNYGRVANNLPPPQQVVDLLHETSITKVKLFDADASVLAAFSGSPFELVVGFPNERIRNAAVKQHFATRWIRENILPFTRPRSGKSPAKITAIAVGNEVFAASTGSSSNTNTSSSRKSRNLGNLLLPAMRNLHAALVYFNLDNQVKLSSPMPLSVLSLSYPPSSGAFREDIAASFMRPFLDFLAATGSHLMVNAYPFFAYESNTGVISLDYALFRPNAGVRDPQTGLLYTNLLEAQLDAVYSAMQALGHRELPVVVSETGWPNNGDSSESGAGVANAAAYNGNLIRRLQSNAGTPMRPEFPLQAFIFALFNENQKPGPLSERNYGLFYPDRSIVYDCGVMKNSPLSRTKSSNRSSYYSPGNGQSYSPPSYGSGTPGSGSPGYGSGSPGSSSPGSGSGSPPNYGSGSPGYGSSSPGSSSPGSGSGSPPSYGSGSPGYGSGSPPGYASGSPGYGSGSPGYGLGSPPGYSAGSPPGYGYSPGYGMGSPPGYSSGSPPGYGSGGYSPGYVKSWCVARAGMNPSSLQRALDFACGKVDCTAIQAGHACFLPDTIEGHASYAMNTYFQINFKAGGTCDFGGNAILTTKNPSYGYCQFP